MTVSNSKPGVSNTDIVLADLIEEIMNQQRRGEPVRLEVYASKYPDHIQQLQELFPALQALADLSQSACPAGSSKARAAGDSATQQVPELRGGILGDFRIIREIGRGGMGIVYEAEQITLGRRVALKILPLMGTLDEKQLQRFKNESRAAASLDHPNIVDVYSVGCERGVQYYAMRFVEGRTLAQVIGELRQASGIGAARQEGVAVAISQLTTDLCSGRLAAEEASACESCPSQESPATDSGDDRHPAPAAGSDCHRAIPSHDTILPLGGPSGRPGGRGA